jgi:hypothetical protein
MTRGGLCWELPMSAPRTNASAFGLLLPKPQAQDAKHSTANAENRAASGRQIQLAHAVALAKYQTLVLKCATPTARDWKSGKASQVTMERNSRPLSEQIGGLLNPTWVEWLMGWPLGWTDLKPSAMVKSHSARQQPSANCLPALAEVA